MNLPQNIKEWWNTRGVSDVILDEYEISWNGSEIVIPIKDITGKILFNKYRKNPFNLENSGPKYKYDKGGSVTLYNETILSKSSANEPVFILEGEGDVLTITSFGFKAVTSTGGASSFQESWVEKFKDLNNIIICLDNDIAGIDGAIKIQMFIPSARILMIPTTYGKDVTEFLQSHSIQDFISLPAYQYPIPQDLEVSLDEKPIKKKRLINNKIEQFKDADKTLSLMSREQLRLGKNINHITMMRDYVSNKIRHYKIIADRFKKRQNFSYAHSIEEIKKIPINKFIDFNSSGYAPCVWHNDSHPSMFYNNETSKFPNTVKCFSCNQMGDVVDVICQMRNCDFKEAVKFLTGK